MTLAYDIPTPADLKARFPRFADVADATVQIWITEAAKIVGTDWVEADYAMGIMLLAAHYMTQEGLGTGAEAEMSAQGLSGFQSIRSGTLSVARFAKGDGEGGDAGNSVYGTTTYGKRFYALLKANRGGPRVTGGGTIPYGFGLPWPRPVIGEA